jgi:hypothetical protein
MSTLAYWLTEAFLPDRPPASRAALLGRAVLLAAVFAYGWSFFFIPIRELGERPGGIHLVHVVFHEAGHVIFGMLGGDFLRVLGGTLGQLTMPAVLLVAFRWKNRDAFAAALMLWWLGQSLADCAPYINDARSLQLVLLGGATGQEVEGHDWEYILTRLGWLHRDVWIAHWVLLTARAAMLASYGWAVAVLVVEWRRGRAAAPAGTDLT